MTELNVHTYGRADAPTMVLVHGLTDDGTCWPDAVAHWENDWRMLAVDQRGHGASPRFTAEQLKRSPDVLEQDLRELLSTLPQPAVLIGHSLGGLMALRVAVENPDLVRALVLEDPAKPSGSWVSDPNIGVEQVAFVDQVSSNPAKELERMRDETSWSESELLAWAPAKAKVDREYLQHGLFLGDASWERLFNELEIPTLVLGPVDGEMLPRREQITNELVHVIEVPGAGHCVRRDQPAAYYQLCDDFLAEV